MRHSIFELPDFFVFYAKLKLFEFLCPIFTWHNIFKKRCYVKAYRV